MESTRQQHSEEATQDHGFTGDVNRLRNDGTASAEELREFISHLHGKSPQEVLGMVAESGLMQGIIMATIGMAATLVVFTIVPYMFSDSAIAEKTAQNKTQSTQSPEPAESTAAAPVTANTTDPNSIDLKKAGAALGIDEAKTADPKSNPLDSKLDSLLDVDK